MSIIEKIEKLKQKLDKEIEINAPYEQILKTSKDIDNQWRKRQRRGSTKSNNCYDDCALWATRK